MVNRRQTVEGKILSTARQRFLGKIDIDRSCSGARGADRKRAGIGKTIQKTLGSDVPYVTPVFSLIDKQADGVACSEIDSKLQMSLGRNRL